jgi:hypothetical protein
MPPVPTHTPDPPPRGRWTASVLVFASVLAAAACFEHSRDWNTATRLLLTHALVDHASIEITRYVAPAGRLLEHPPTRDLARSADGRYFCDKAPGQSFLGAPAYAVASRLLAQPAVNDGRPEPTDFWTTLFSSGLATAATAACLVAAIWGMNVRPTACAAAGLAYPFATFAQAYGTLYYGHAAAALCLTFAIATLLPDFDSAARNALAGLFAGLAVAVEYPCAAFAAAVFLVHGARRIGLRRGPAISAPLAFAAAGAAPLLPLAYYHFLVTGSPWRVPYTLEVLPEFAFHGEGAGVPIHLPDPKALAALLVSPARGLLWHGAVLAAAAPGLVLMVRRGRAPVAAVILLTFISFLLIAAGFPNWHGGLATGPRLLLPAIPLLMIPVGVWLGDAGGRRRLRAAWGAVAVASFVWITAVNAAGARVPHALKSVASDYVVANLNRPRPGESHLGQWVTGSPTGLAPLAATLLALAVLASVPLAAARRIEAHSRRGSSADQSDLRQDWGPFVR